MFQNRSISNLYETNELDSPIECNKLLLLGFGHVLIFMGSLIFNSFLLWIFANRKRDERNSIDIFVAVMAFLNFIGSLVEIPFVVLSQLHCRWIFKPFGCHFSAFVMYFVGCSTIHLMTAISFERYYVIKNTLINGGISNNTKIKIIIFCLMSGFFWAILPILGWSKYTLEKSKTTCSVVWHEKSILVYSYNVTVFFFVYLIPLILMIFIYMRLLVMIFKLKTVLAEPQNRFMLKKRIFMERRSALIMIIITTGFMIAWTPYAVIAMYVVFVDSKGFSPITEAIPSLIAKSSMLWTAVLYYLTNRIYPQKRTVFIKKSGSYKTKPKGTLLT